MSSRLNAIFLGGEVGLRERQGYSEHTAAQIGERYEFVRQLLSQHRAELNRIALALLERESLDAEQLQQLLSFSNTATESIIAKGASTSEVGGASLAVPALES